MTTIINELDDQSLNAEAINENLRILASAINQLAGSFAYHVGGIPVAGSDEYVPKTGGAFNGAVSAPSVLIGTQVGGFDLAVSKADLASIAEPGIVKQAAALADLNQNISASYVEAEVQAISDKLDALLGRMRSAGVLDT